MAEIDKVWTRSNERVLDELDVSRDGLNGEEVKQRRERYGPNQLREAQRKSAWEILIEQFKSLVVILLVVAAIVSFAFGDIIEGIAITVVIFINAGIGFSTELSAVRSMEALQKMSDVSAKVRREGEIREVSANKLVPGDIIVVGGGDIVTADARLIEASKLQTNESALTGESVPVSKQVEPLGEEVPLAERANMIYKGTSVTRGSGEAVIVATGMDTELGQISSLVEEAEDEVTPLEKRLDDLGRKLVQVVLVIAAIVAGVGILAGKEAFTMVETAIALAVASVPEGLPIVATIALARGMRRMAERNALINQLSSVETLGATSVILTDKTGTLTENQMTVSRYAFASGEVEVSGEGLELEGDFSKDGSEIDPTDRETLELALRVGVLCNNAVLSINNNAENDDQNNQAVGDPLEIALLVAGAKAGLRRAELLEEYPEAREVAFDTETKMMATYNDEDGRYRVSIKGAPSAVLNVSTTLMEDGQKKDMTEEMRQQWQGKTDQLAGDGLRMLALATKIVDSTDDEPYKELTFLGLVGLLDPPREEVRPVIQACKDAGINVVMVTGDQPVTARNVAKAVGLIDADDAKVIHGSDLKDPDELDEEGRRELLETPIFARVNPKQKLNLIEAHQDAGAIVAMTGDGVNDAPALKKAEIGVAMGRRGTQVAREASDMVLKDDAFSTIVTAVRQGRVIFDNIRKFVLYLLSCNISEVLVVALASIANMPLPIRPLQILFLNLVTDVFPALALGVGEGGAGIMERSPRDSDEPVLARRHWTAIAGYGAVITVAVLAAFILALNSLAMDTKRAVTVSFLTLAFAQLWNVFNMRGRTANLFDNEITRNPYIWGALVLCILLLLAAVYVPVLADVMGIVDPGLKGWALVLGMSVIPLIVGQIFKQFEMPSFLREE